MILLQGRYALLDVVGADNHICLLAIGKGVHILNEYIPLRELLKDGGECSRLVAALDAYHQIGRASCRERV